MTFFSPFTFVFLLFRALIVLPVSESRDIRLEFVYLGIIFDKWEIGDSRYNVYKSYHMISFLFVYLIIFKVFHVNCGQYPVASGEEYMYCQKMFNNPCCSSQTHSFLSFLPRISRNCNTSRVDNLNIYIYIRMYV